MCIIMSEIESSLYIVDNMCFGEEISISEVQETYFTNISSISGPSLKIHSDLPLTVTTNVDTGPKFNILKDNFKPCCTVLPWQQQDLATTVR